MFARFLCGCLVFVVAAGFSLGQAAWGQNDGQEDLDQALELAVAPQSVSDLTKIIELCESSLEKGLDEDNAKFATQLLSSTLVKRGTVVSQSILKGDLNDPRIRERFAQFRRIALKDLEQALEYEPKMAQAHYLIGRLHSLPGGERDKAMEHLNKAIDESGEENLFKAQALAARGDLHEENDKRLADYNAAVELAPLKAKIRISRGKFFLEQRQFDKALEDLDIAIEEDPDNAETYQVRGTAYLLSNRIDDALADFNQAIELDPHSPVAYTHRARIHLLKANPMAAVSDLDKALSANPANPAAYLLRASAYHQLQNNDKAIEDVKRVLEIQPGLVAAERMYAALLANSNQLDKAIEELTKTVEDKPDDIASLARLAMLYVEKRDLPNAIEAYTDILERSPKNQFAYHRRADAYLFSGEQAKAIADYNMALELAPNDSEVLNNLAWTLATSPDDRLRDGKRAVELATQACDVTGYREAHILSTLAAAHAESGDFATAIEWSEKAVAMGDDTRQEQLKKELESYKSGKPWRELQTVEMLGGRDEKEAPDEKASDEKASDEKSTGDKPSDEKSPDEPKDENDKPKDKPKEPSKPSPDSDEPPADDPPSDDSSSENPDTA